MEDLTDKLKQYGERKSQADNEELLERRKEFRQLLTEIESHSDQFDIWVRNYNNAIDVGIQFFNGDDGSYREGNFATGGNHRFGFIFRSEMYTRVFGVVCNSHDGRSYVYYRDGHVAYDNSYDREYNSSDVVPIDRLKLDNLREYCQTAKDFLATIDEFDGAFSYYLNKYI